MVSVVIAANSREKKFWSAIRSILGRNFECIQCVKGSICVRCDKAGLFVTDAIGVKGIHSGPVVYICKDYTKPPVEIEALGGKLAVVDSRSKEAIRLASETGLMAITCGLSPCDTITLSSISDEDAVIGLQRCVTCFDGSVAEPQEIPVSLFAPVDSFVLMCAAAIFILTGNLKKLTKTKI